MIRISITFLFVFIPFLLSAQSSQPVQPVVSNDYLRLIAPRIRVSDSSYSLRKSALVLDEPFDLNMPVKRISILDNRLRVVRNDSYRLALGGSINTTIELRSINRLPALQEQYVQGRSLNGQPVYQENDVFSYGPSLQPGAPVYHHTVFRTAAMFSQALNLQADLYKNYTQLSNFDLKLGQSREQTFIRENENSSRNMALTLSTHLNALKITGGYNYQDARFTNSNRNGFLNRAYQNSLLTPVSFGDPYNSYSPLADNPAFLLQNSGNNHFQSQQNISLIIQSKWYRQFDYKLTQSFEKVQENSLECYKPGTAFFPAGISFLRKKNDANYFLNANGTYHLDVGNDDFKSEITGTYTLQASRTHINAYRYQRTTQLATLGFSSRYQYEGLQTSIGAGNHLYVSNTLTKNKYFAPYINLFTQLSNVPKGLYISASASYNQSYSELPISSSLSYANLLQYTAAQAMQYFPVKEISGYGQMQPVGHQEWTGNLILTYRNKFFLSGEVFLRDVQDDMFPVYENDVWLLKNIADHHKRGIELNLRMFETFLYKRLLSTTNRISFYTYNDKVTQVADGYNFLPVAGFSDVHKAIVKGETFGAIVGNTYERDASGQLIIGADGFPLVNDQLSVIGDPIPDFVMKMSHELRWKQLTLGIDLEWKKGGDVWNGTQAALDYYGRSLTSGMERNTKGYIYPGVTADGHVNTKPVDQNRWVKYGPGGVAEAYIQKGDHLRINNLQLSWQLYFKHKTKFPQKLTLSTYMSNLLIWTAYKGVDPNQVLYDQSNTTGLDLFNLPATKTYGFNASLQF